MSRKKAPYAPRVARTIEGGLRLQNAHRTAWWRQRWITFMEGLGMGARLGRGRNYAQLGQIKSLTLLPGELSATIQGAASEPYQLRITMAPMDPTIPAAILKERPAIAAQLYTRNLPMLFESELQQRGLTLFPTTKQDLTFECSCKDWARPCKHLAAALFLFADAISSDPLLLLKFRGLALPEPRHDLTPQRLPLDHVLRLQPVADPATPLRRLGSIASWRGSEDLLQSLEPAMQRAHDKALTLLESRPVDFRFPTDMPTIKESLR